MKTWRVVTLLSFTISIAVVAFIITIQLRYPDFMFFWKPIVVFLIPLIVILALLNLRHRWTHIPFSRALLAASLAFIALTALGYMGLPILGVALVALLALFIASRALSELNVRP